MDKRIGRALETDRTIDISTIGRHSGQSHRLEIWFHNLDGVIYLTGSPGPRDWYANLRANPQFTFHLKESLRADRPARAELVLDEDERRSILGRIASSATLEEWVHGSPLVRVAFDPG